MALKIKANQCQSCEKRLLLAPGYCPQCRKKNSFMPIEVEGIGTIFSYTVVHVGEERMQADTPYPLAVIEINGGLRVLGRIEQADTRSLQIGARVELVEYKDQVPFFRSV